MNKLPGTREEVRADMSMQKKYAIKSGASAARRVGEEIFPTRFDV